MNRISTATNPSRWVTAGRTAVAIVEAEADGRAVVADGVVPAGAEDAAATAGMVDRDAKN